MSTITINLTAYDSVSNDPVPNAMVFIDGSTMFPGGPLTTGAYGQSTFNYTFTADDIATGSAEVALGATNYNPSYQTVNTSADSPVNLTYAMVGTNPGGDPIDLQFEPGVGGITWTLDNSSSTQIDNGVSLSDGSATSNISLANGSYTVNASASGYNSVSQSIQVNGQDGPYTITLSQPSNPTSVQTGNSNGTSNTPGSVGGNNLSSTTTTTPNNSEYIYPNTDYDKYFTITGARIYIGDLFIDELNSIQFALQDNAVPIYGYASRYYDALAQGRSLVQGQLALNFVSEGYLYTVLTRAANMMGTAGNASNADLMAVNKVLGLMGTRNSLTQQQANNPNALTTAQPNNQYLGGSGPTAGSIVTPTTQGTTPETSAQATAVNQISQAAALQTQITALMNAMTPSQTALLSTMLAAQSTNASGAVQYDNAVYQDVIFDIRIDFANEITGIKRTRYIEKCKLISNEQVIAPDGQVLLDAYGFIGRRLR